MHRIEDIRIQFYFRTNSEEIHTIISYAKRHTQSKIYTEILEDRHTQAPCALYYTTLLPLRLALVTDRGYNNMEVQPEIPLNY